VSFAETAGGIRVLPLNGTSIDVGSVDVGTDFAN
jgi:hypothetical protein